MDSERMIEVATLGRPFSLGMLYDCRQDTVIPGLTLWDCADLEKDTRESPKPNSDFEIVASESIEDKSSSLAVEASLKASFLGGLVKVEGSAKYLNDQMTSKNQARVTLKYKTTTKFQELSMNHLGRGNVKHSYVFENKLATHVVTGILYGAQAFFVFDQEKSETESHQDIQGNLKVLIEKIPCLSIEGEGSLKLEDKDIEKIKKFSCKFHGDFLLQKTPTTFQDAVEVYQSLPKLLGASGENAVPIKVWMLPLTNLDSSAAKLVREISVGLVQEVQSVLEELSELEIRCNDAMRNITTQQFSQISKKIKSFKSMCSEFRLGFQQTLAKKLPSIRGGGEEESELADVLKGRHSSPFNSKNLNEWMDCKEREIHILKSFTRMMKNTKIIPSQNEVDEELLSADHALCFVFTSLERHEPYLSALSNHLKGRTGTDDSHIYDVEKEQWYLSNNVADEMRRKVKLFSDFAEANKESTAFLTVGLTDKKHEGSTIYLYKDGLSISENFEPPSKPESVTAADINHNSVTLNISPPLFGAENITSYSVEYRVSGEDEWKQKIEPKSAELTVSHLKPNTEYVFRCRAVTSAGVGPANAINDPIKTLPCSPPGESQVEPNSSEISLSWEKPAELGPDVQILSYIVEYASTANSSKVEDLLWNQTRSRGEKATISGLHSETQYSVRVRCDCGGAGRSKENKIVKVCTTKREFGRLAEYLKDISKKTNSSLPSVYELPLRKDDMDIDGCQRYIFGKESLRPNRTIMLLGATGSGKSTLINGMINYIVGVKWNDGFRFKLINEDSSMSQAHSQTSEVTVYEIYHQDGFKIPYSLTVIDTPGFGDTRGVTRDREITEQIRRIFTSAEGVTEIDAVCFVTQASLARLTATQKYVFESVLSIFGKDVAENIVMLVTFADGKQPPVLEAINLSGVPCPKNDLGFPVHFKFNNSALFAHTKCHESRAHDEESAEDEDESFDEMFWKMGVKSMEKFFTALGKMTSKSLLMTKEVLKERKQLETAIEGLQPQVRAGLAKLEEIKTTKQKIKEHEAIITSNENFEIEVDVIKPIQKQLSGKGEFITNCQKCSITCHYPCIIAEDNKKHGCNAMDNKGMCTVCPGKCIWNVHFNQKYKWEYVQVKEKKTVQELKSKYEKAAKEKLTTEQLIERQEEEIAHLQDIMLSLMDQSADCITRLQEIALRPNPLAAPDYIDMLIEGEKAEAKKGYEARIKSLEEMKEKAQLMSKVSQQDKLTKPEEQLSAERQKRKESGGYLKRVLNFFGFSG
ncbi:uncharacterized protein LOC124870140 [Girardinichthys multiradiatus]|uniref:uncharacterized protein LOC124869709 n=1 Tax=Girardinichthys multiradiatus TaxID=208333 RepID=UPI001FAB8D71|nr:uncharacterized protein LOC124869709 [Girardinichthys multiradiatus]XP_047224620.1 uncharacterized protein LOC124870140 [Girardinichthys multiradiatus]